MNEQDVERVARAIADSRLAGKNTIEMARAAIAAMKQPVVTDEMVKAADAYLQGWRDRGERDADIAKLHWGDPNVIADSIYAVPDPEQK